jgi:hypothetical protein
MFIIDTAADSEQSFLRYRSSPSQPPQSRERHGICLTPVGRLEVHFADDSRVAKRCCARKEISV